MGIVDKFAVGQVVRIGNKPLYGIIARGKDHEGRYLVRFYDADISREWEWDYMELEIKELSAKERRIRQ